MGDDNSTLNPNSQGRGWRETLKEMEDKRRHQRGSDEIAGIKVGAQEKRRMGKKTTLPQTHKTQILTVKEGTAPETTNEI